MEAFRTASPHGGLVLLTGGLGPTQDDLTREALARLAGVELVFNAEVYRADPTDVCQPQSQHAGA